MRTEQYNTNFKIELKKNTFIIQGHHWVPSSTYGALPHNAVIAGNDSDGSPIYIGRAFHAGDQIPVKVLPSKQAAYLSYGGQEIHVANYEVKSIFLGFSETYLIKSFD